MMNKFHLGIYGFLEKEANILVIKKTRGPYSGMFDLPGGRPKHGEDIFDTLVREVMEETGVRVLGASHFCNASFCVDYEAVEGCVSLHHIALIYRVTQFDLSGIHQIEFEDVSGYDWIPKSTIKNLPISKVVQCVL